MSERATIYIGGTLIGMGAELVNSHWHPYRDDNGHDVDTGTRTDVEMTRKPAKERGNYYLAGLPGGDWRYVHLLLWHDYCGARPWLDAHDAAPPPSAISVPSEGGVRRRTRSPNSREAGGRCALRDTPSGVPQLGARSASAPTPRPLVRRRGASPG